MEMACHVPDSSDGLLIYFQTWGGWGQETRKQGLLFMVLLFVCLFNLKRLIGCQIVVDFLPLTVIPCGNYSFA